MEAVIRAVSSAFAVKYAVLKRNGTISIIKNHGS
jgi:hypothetical protein